MKMNKFFAVAFAATTLFASCSKEQGVSDSKVSGVESYAGISVSFPKMSTKAPVDPSATYQPCCLLGRQNYG